uniref:Uncharacterized protein n=1 Tax=Globodera rostochiensis TaxID=31243 RepID=A0A914HRI4_GLORO
MLAYANAIQWEDVLGNPKRTSPGTPVEVPAHLAELTVRHSMKFQKRPGIHMSTSRFDKAAFVRSGPERNGIRCPKQSAKRRIRAHVPMQLGSPKLLIQPYYREYGFRIQLEKCHFLQKELIGPHCICEWYPTRSGTISGNSRHACAHGSQHASLILVRNQIDQTL